MRSIIQAALDLDGFDAAAAQQKMSPVPRATRRSPDRPGRARVGAVLIVLFEQEGETYLLLIKRRPDLKDHPGQISFPGGRREGSETLQETALRETAEEIGIDGSALALLGGIKPVYIPPSDFIVHPFVAWHKGPPGLKRNPAEVAEIIQAPLSGLTDAPARHLEIRRGAAGEVGVPCYLIGGHRVWGGTAMMLSEILERLAAVKAGETGSRIQGFQGSRDP